MVIMTAKVSKRKILLIGLLIVLAVACVDLVSERLRHAVIGGAGEGAR